MHVCCVCVCMCVYVYIYVCAVCVGTCVCMCTCVRVCIHPLCLQHFKERTLDARLGSGLDQTMWHTPFGKGVVLTWLTAIMSVLCTSRHIFNTLLHAFTITQTHMSLQSLTHLYTHKTHSPHLCNYYRVFTTQMHCNGTQLLSFVYRKSTELLTGSYQ